MHGWICPRYISPLSAKCQTFGLQGAHSQQAQLDQALYVAFFLCHLEISQDL